MRQREVGVVSEIRAERPGAQEVLVRTEAAGERVALVLCALTGTVQVGDHVLLNTIAVEMGLGTGGLDFVVTVLPSETWEATPAGHIVKLRYTPHQTPVLAVEAPESPHHDAIRRFTSLDDTPVVCAELHSQLPAICAAARWELEQQGWARPPRIVYIMTDSAALPLALSRLLPQLKAKELLTTTITAGQAFGGDLEAVNLYSALAAAKQVAEADIIVVGQGPGNVGTETALGFSGIDQGLAANAVASLGGVPIVVARLSFADPRDRHNGLSHHTVTILTRITHAPTLLPLPRLPSYQQEVIWESLIAHTIPETHQPITIDAEKGLAALETSGIPVTTMGRSLKQERVFFLAAAAAGLLAAQLAEARLA